ncbi:MAG: GNAT family N-acetyltransferase [Bacteroidales bacterium]|jgi:ribosomal protein S18 acetylase RimI-like enzyme|nr:GNAT family N-acetyltransferase [Bacteroidales bacterium]MDD2264606.1 GNAT family N-acetyltransferase [Bacteroidales bacterium]MDD2831989.1 GNAT family N-acetyltransferase [Bacteroidales bacterium]MDD3208992.1 GNAT family N-acetyltransferase [Bacteroidales bacterium]MDD3697826.1 GNAT family N-acetyltransferase [Bacteroidales bacterium]
MSFTFRNILHAKDLQVLEKLMKTTGLFYDFEIAVALEVLGSFLERGEASGYHCIVAQQDRQCAGYAVFGPTPCTRSGWDIYWMAVRKDLQGMGLGSQLITIIEKEIVLQGGSHIWIETSGRQDYLPTRKFYEKHRYRIMAQLPDFYAPGDSKVIYGKQISFFQTDNGQLKNSRLPISTER